MDVERDMENITTHEVSTSSEINQHLRCVIHVMDEETTEKITLFKTDTLQTCLSFLKFRKSCNLKYSDFILPETVDTTRGYHMKCYRTFTALNTRLRNNMKEMFKSLPKSDDKTIRSSNQPSSSQSSTGVFNQVCIFCGKQTRKHKGDKGTTVISKM